MVSLGTEITVGVGVVLAIGMIYVFAGTADTLRRGRRRNGGKFAPDRTTQVERGLTIVGLLAIIITAMYLFGP